MIATRSLMLSASSWSWVTKRKVMPTSRWIALSSACIACRSLRSSAASGSSSSSTLGSVDQRAGQRDALPLTAGQPARLLLAAVAELDQLEHLGDAPVERGPVETPAAQAEADVAADVEVLEEGVALEDRVDVALVRGRAGDVLAADEDRAGGRVAEAGDHPQRRGLAAARRAEQGEELAARDVEVEVVDDGGAAEDLGQAAQRDATASSGRGACGAQLALCSSAFASGDQVQAGRPAVEQAGQHQGGHDQQGRADSIRVPIALMAGETPNRIEE